MRILLLLAFAAGSVFGQSLFSGVDNVASDPAGACAYKAGPTYFGRLQYNVSNGNLWGCKAGTWTLITGTSAAACSGDIIAGCSQVTNLSHVSNSSLANSGLANPSVSVNGATCTLGSSCNPGTGFPVPQHVQSVAPPRGTITTFSLPFSGTSGNISIVCLGWYGGANTASVLSDNQSTSYTKIVELTGAASSDNISIWAGVLGGSGTVTYTATFPAAAGFEGAYASEYLASTLTTTVDASTSARDAAISLTTSTAGDLLYTCADGIQSGGSFSTPPTWSIVGQTASNDSGAAAVVVQPVAGFVSATPAVIVNTHYALAAIALKHP